MRQNVHTKLLVYALTLIIAFGMVCVNNEKNVSAAYKRYVTASTLAIRKKASATSKKVGSYKQGKKITCYGTKGNWTKVKYSGATRYVYTTYLSVTNTPVTTSTSSTSTTSISNSTQVTTKGTDVANYALKFVGNPYKYGGTSLTNGADCSGFTQSVYKYFGYKIPRNSTDQRSAGVAVSWENKQPGDLICYYGHVAIYIGNNKVVHASSEKTGIKITSPADYRSVACVRRIVK